MATTSHDAHRSDAEDAEWSPEMRDISERFQGGLGRFRPGLPGGGAVSRGVFCQLLKTGEDSRRC
eukprot:1764837-Prymnesium_polylepis.1